MRELPPLGKDTVVRLSRQGGFAPLHALSKPREIEFGQYDSAQRGRICSVLERCLPESEALARVVDTHLHNLRRKLEAAGLPGVPVTVRAIGYRFS